MEADGQSLDPRTGADRSVAHLRVTDPVGQSGLTSARPKTLQTWKQEMTDCAMIHAKKVDEDAKILAMKSIMPGTLFGEAGVFRGGSFNFFVDLRTAIINNLDDKVPVSRMKQGPPMSATNMVQSIVEREQGEDEEAKHEVTQDEMFTVIQQFWKGKGKGKEENMLELW